MAPTLRNIAITGPYMHDGSVATLGEALDRYAGEDEESSPGLAGSWIPHDSGQSGGFDPRFWNRLDGSGVIAEGGVEE